MTGFSGGKRRSTGIGSIQLRRHRANHLRLAGVCILSSRRTARRRCQLAARPRESMPGKDDPALTKNADSGGAHSKGYSAESCPPPPELDNDPLPLAKDPSPERSVSRARSCFASERF